jgi:hypothetical protein
LSEGAQKLVSDNSVSRLALQMDARSLLDSNDDDVVDVRSNDAIY